MKCSECNSRKFEYDERLQQNCCVECGFVMVENPFEETVKIKYADLDEFRAGDKGTLGSLIGESQPESKQLRRALRTTRARGQSNADLFAKNGQREARFYNVLKVLMSNYNTSDGASIRKIVADIITYFRRLDKSHDLRGYTNDERAAGLSYIVFREHGWPVSLHSISKHSDVERGRVSKVARTFARKLGKTMVLSQVPFVSWCEREANIMGGEEFGIAIINIAPLMQNFFMEYGFPLTRVQVATTMYLCNLLCGFKYTQRNIGKQLKTYPISIRDSLQRICAQLDIKRDDLLTMSMDDFINGVF